MPRDSPYSDMHLQPLYQGFYNLTTVYGKRDVPPLKKNCQFVTYLHSSSRYLVPRSGVVSNMNTETKSRKDLTKAHQAHQP